MVEELEVVMDVLERRSGRCKQSMSVIGNTGR